MNTNNNIIAVFTALSIAFLGSTAILHEKTEIPTASMSANAAETYGDLTYTVSEKGTIIITDCDESAEEVIIPDEIDGIPVTAIGNKAFENCKLLKSIIIPDSIKKLSYGTFTNCESLTSVKIPDEATSIYYFTFANCKSLTSIIIPDSVVEIQEDAFAGCDKLSSIVIPESVKGIYQYAFSCKNLEKITVLNPYCNIYDEVTAFNQNDIHTEKIDTIISTATICGYENSTAQEYAENHNCKFESLGEIPQKFMTATSTTTTTTTTTSTSRTNTQTETGTRGTEGYWSTGTQTNIHSTHSNSNNNTGTTTTTTANNDKLLGDINGDGLIDSVDATLIMSYYAYVSAYEGNGEPDTFPEYLDKYLNK